MSQGDKELLLMLAKACLMPAVYTLFIGAICTYFVYLGIRELLG